MALISGTAALIGLGVAAAGATGGAIGSAVNRSKAEAERTRAYNEAKSFLDSEYYRDPLSTTGNRALLKSIDERMRDNQDAMNNRMVAGGATMENQLAAREANNRVMGGVYTNLLQAEDARRDSIARQKMQLDQQYSQGTQAGFLQAAQDWQSWGSQMANAGMAFGSSGLLGGEAAGAAPTFGEVAARQEMMQPIINTGVKTPAFPGVIGPEMGGLHR